MSVNKQSRQTFTSENDFSKRLANLLEMQLFCDVKLIAGTDNTHLMAHRVILATASEYFQAKFSKEDEAKELHIVQIDGGTLKSVIRFIYSKSIELQDHTVDAISKAAQLFQLKDLQVGCLDYLARKSSPPDAE